MHQVVPRHPSFARSCLTVLVSLGLVAACGSDDGDAPSTSAPASSDAAGSTSSAPSESSVASAGPVGTNGSGEFDQALFDLLPSSIQESGSLRFAAVWEDAPKISVDASDASTPVGFAPDLAKALEPILGVTIEWENIQWPGQLPGVQAGVVDVLFPQVTITAEREQSIVDLVPFWKSTLSVLVPAGNPLGLTGLKDACGKRIAVAIGSTVEAEARAISQSFCVDAGKPAISVEMYNGPVGAISAVQAGTVDGWINDTVSQEAVTAKEGDLFATVVMPEDEHPTDLSGFAIGKDQPGVTMAILGAFRQLVEDGTYAAILDDYDLAPVAIALDEVVPNPRTGTPVGEKAA